MTKEKVEELVKKLGLREVVRINNIIAKEEGNLDDVVYFAEEFDTFCKGVRPSAIAKLVSEGYDMEMCEFFSFDDCIIFIVDCLGDLVTATTKKGVGDLLAQTLKYADSKTFSQLVNKDYIDKF